MPPLGSTAHTFTTPARMKPARPAMIAHSTADLPAPVAPTISTWLPSSRSSHVDPSSARATGSPSARRRPAANGSTTAASGSRISSHSCTRCGFRQVRTRQSRAPKVWASRSATST